MTNQQNEYFPQSVTHPGLTLAEKLEELGMSQKEFAVRTYKPEQTIVNVVKGKSSITSDMAVRFEDVLKIPASFWLKRQRTYDEAVAREKREFAISEAFEWAKSFPYSKMAKLGWVITTRNIQEKVSELFKFFGVSDHRAWEKFYFEAQLKTNFRISLANTNHAHSISAWLRKGEIDALAEPFPEKEYNAKKFKKNLVEIKSIMASQPEDFFPKLKALCNDAGILLTYTPCLPGAPIHGSTRWINDRPLIQLSARYKKNDIFWFTFFHEAGHILKHGKKYISIENIELREHDEKKEEEADDFAIEWTFSEAQEKEVLESSLNETTLIEFAKKFNTHPAIIIGRLQHRGILPYSMGREFVIPIDLN